jgi:hypothetical protein
MICSFNEGSERDSSWNIRIYSGRMVRHVLSSWREAPGLLIFYAEHWYYLALT